MFFWHLVLSNYEQERRHPIGSAILHWLLCLALTLASGFAVVVLLLILAVSID